MAGGGAAILLGSFAAGLLGLGVTAWLESRVQRRLERAHPDVMRHFDESRGPTTRLVGRFIWRNQHARMGDPALTRLILRARIAGIGTCCIFVAGFIGFRLVG